MATTEKLQFVIEAVDKTSKQLDDINKKLDSLTDGMDKNNKKAKEMGMNWDKLKVAGLATFGVVSAVVAKSVKDFSDLNESVNAVQVVFGSGASKILEFGQNAATAVGMSNAEFNQMSVGVGALFRDTGLSMEEVANKTITLSQRAADMASVFNTDVSDAMSAIQQALRGETEAIRRYAGNVSDATLQQYAMSQGLKKNVTDLTESEKRLLRYDLIMQQTNVTQGDFANTSDSLANKQRIMQATMTNLSATLGSNVTPSVNLLQNGLMSMITTIDKNGKPSMEGFGKALYVATNFILAFVEAFKMTAQVLVLGLKIFTSGGEIISAFGEAMVLALKGKFGEAKDTIKNAFSGIGDSLSGQMEKINNTTASMGYKLGQMVKPTDFKPAEISTKNGVDNINKSLSNLGNDANTKQAKENIKKLAEAFKDSGKIAGDSLFELEQDHKKTMEGIRAEISKTTQEMAKLTDEYNKSKAGEKMSMAEKIVANQDEIAKLQQSLAGNGLSGEERAQQQADLDARLLAIQENAGFIQQFEAEIAEVKRRNALTELEREIEDYNKRQEMAQAEYNSNMARLQGELSALQNKANKENEIYSAKVKFINDINDEIERMTKESQDKAVNGTKESIEKEIAYYKQLAEAIKAARSANTDEFSRIMSNFNAIGAPKTTSVNDAIISPYGKIISTHPDDYLIATKDPQSLAGSGGITVNITGNSFMGRENIAEQIGNDLMKIVKQNMKL